MSFRNLWPVLLLFVLMGCLPKKGHHDAHEAMAAHRWDEAYRKWQEVLEEDPGNTRARIEGERSRLNASLVHLQKATSYLNRRLLNEAEFEANLVLSLDPHNQEAERILGEVLDQRRRDADQESALEQASLSALPSLNPSTWDPLNLYFPKPTAIKDIYTSIGKAYGVNIVIDNQIRNDKMTLDLRNLSFLKALDTLMVLNRHFFKVIDDNTLIILEDTKTNRDRYDNQIVQTFYLSNITPKDLKSHLRQLGGIKEFAENDKLNAITIKGTPEQIALAEKIITANDKSQPEVIIEIEILEVNKNLMRRIGILPVNPTDGSVSYRAGVIADPVGRTDDDTDQGGIRGVFPSLNSTDYLTLVPAVAVDFMKENGDSKQIANPHLRVSSGEKGQVVIGESIPVANTSFTNAQLSGSTGGGSRNFGDQALTTFKYNDVGISIVVTPRVHYNGEITLVLELEVSSVLSAGFQPTFGKREVNTTIRLKNGETNVLAGLLTNDERKSASGIPGLADLPLIGKLFSNSEKITRQTDIVMTIRPVIIRGPKVTGADRSPYELSTLRLSSLFAREAKTRKNQKKTAPAEDAYDSSSGGTVDPPVSDGVDQGDDYQPEDETGEDEAAEDTYDGDDEYAEEEGPAPALLAFTPPMIDARQDDFIEVQLFVTNVEGLTGGEIVLEYDPAVLAVDGVGMGDFFKQKGSRANLVPAWDNSKGTLGLVLSQRSTMEPLSGSGILANIRFQAKGPGDGALLFRRINLRDNEDVQLAADGLPANYEVAP